ncbi:MAG: BrnA antitoxin family protein [Burkholderiaceae bacterium]|jgi:uncharacterized protein (DUF4415 family)|nr:BrnA antitoxin family protein [Burkholderiaceae bacterium]
MNKKTNPELLDDDNPEWTEEMFKNAMSFSDLPEALQAKLRRVRGPNKLPTKKQTAIRFDAEVLDGLRATGRGWQTRVNNVMREWLKQHSA